MKNDLAQAYLLINQGETQARPLVGISACLCGDKVRYDGQENGLPDLVLALEKRLDLLRVCPEVAIGMGVPRPPILLRLNQGIVEARGVENSAHNVTPALQSYAQSLIKRHSPINQNNDVLCGFILKSRSPSCGVASTPIHEESHRVGLGSGIFAQQLQQQLPWLPIIEEGALTEPRHQLVFVMQSQLVRLFWEVARDEADGPVSFHKKIGAMLEVFPVAARTELKQLAKCSASTSSLHYLIYFMKTLQAAQRPF